MSCIPAFVTVQDPLLLGLFFRMFFFSFMLHYIDSFNQFLDPFLAEMIFMLSIDSYVCCSLFSIDLATSSLHLVLSKFSPHYLLLSAYSNCL